jgi:hypothetical protein
MNQFCSQQFFDTNNGYKYQHFYNTQNLMQTELQSTDSVEYSSQVEEQIQLYHSHQLIEYQNQRQDSGSSHDNGFISIQNMEKYDNNCGDGMANSAVSNGILNGHEEGSHNACFQTSNEWITSEDRCDASGKTRSVKSESATSTMSSTAIRVPAITTGSKEILFKIYADVMARWLTYCFKAISSIC